MKYQLHVDQRKLTAEGEKAGKRKAVQDEVHAVESKRKLLEESIAPMSQEADALTVQAEKKHSFVFTGSMLLDKKIHESKANEQSLYEQAHSLKQKLKFME